MAAVFAVLVSANLIFSNVRLTGASTHWMVTEDGKVQAQVDSVFNMKRPYDLVAFMKQEDRVGMLEKLKLELLSRKDEIDKTEDRDTGLEDKFYKTDNDCLAAGKQLPDLDLYISTVLPLENKGIRPDDYLPAFVQGSILMQPDCSVYTELPYSPYAFEHLEGMKDRRKLPGTPELGLKNAITYQDNVDEYGHRIYEAFKHNKTSWVLYNMAAFYWRIKGDPYNVIECVRRALHYSPRFQKDVALISLANVLHRAQKSNEAAIVVHAALDISKELNVNHFTLGNIYAVLGEYNKSVICFENTLKIQPDFEAAAKRKHAVLCHAKLEAALEAQHRSLQRTLNDLKDYQRKHDYWQQQNDKMLAEQVPVEVKLAQHVAYEEHKIKEISSDIGEYCRMGDKDGKQVLMCSWGKKADPALGMDFTAQKLPVEQPPAVPEPPMQPDPEPQVRIPAEESSKDYSKPVRGHKYTYETVKVPRPQGVITEYLQENWPSKNECDLHVSKVPNPGNLTSSYISPENKGYEVRPLLTEALGLKDGDEHPLPWFPPICVTQLDIPEGNTKSHDDIPSISLEQRKTIPLKLVDTRHTQLLLDHANNGRITIEEIGQRILSGLKQKGGPKWILYNLAGLYWRIIGNNYHSIECFRRSIYTAPDNVQDVPEINLANVLYRWGKYNDAKSLIRESMKLNPYEPATNFLLGNIEWALKNHSGAIYRYELALEAEQGYTDALHTLRALKCYLRYHQAGQSAAPTEARKRPCVPPHDKMESQSRLVCHSDSGEEKCVVETRSRNKQGANGGGNGGSNQNTCQGQPRGPTESTPGTVSEDVFFEAAQLEDPEDRLEYLKEHVCTTEECNKLKIQNGQAPHIKLEFINGQLLQKLIFAQSTNEMTVRPEECVIYNDGTKSDGCSRPEFQAYIGKLEADDISDDTDSVMVYVNGHVTRVLPVLHSDGMEHVRIQLGTTPKPGPITPTANDKTGSSNGHSHQTLNDIVKVQFLTEHDKKPGPMNKHDQTAATIVSADNSDRPRHKDHDQPVPPALPDTDEHAENTDAKSNTKRDTGSANTDTKADTDTWSPRIKNSRESKLPQTSLDTETEPINDGSTVGEAELSEPITFRTQAQSEYCSKFDNPKSSRVKHENDKQEGLGDSKSDNMYCASGKSDDNRCDDHDSKHERAMAKSSFAESGKTKVDSVISDIANDGAGLVPSVNSKDTNVRSDDSRSDPSENTGTAHAHTVNEGCGKISDANTKDTEDKSGDSRSESSKNTGTYAATTGSSSAMPKPRHFADIKLQLSDGVLPDVRKFIFRRHNIPVPSREECATLPDIDLRKFSSTWLSLHVKYVHLPNHIDFRSPISPDDYLEPVCRYKVPVQSVADLLPGVQHRYQLDYAGEAGLKQVLQRMGPRLETLEISATRIAVALAKNETSWVLTNMASLYWRVRGDAGKALDCLRIAMLTSFIQTKDVALLSIANILHRAGFINDAIVAVGHAMDLSPKLVVAHFNMANLFAAKGQWETAAMLYESTLGLQPSFDPARKRLKLIHCQKLLKP